jgi:hypothetical protein
MRSKLAAGMLVGVAFSILHASLKKHQIDSAYERAPSKLIFTLTIEDTPIDQRIPTSSVHWPVPLSLNFLTKKRNL